MKAEIVTRRSLRKGLTIVKRGDTWHAEIFSNGKSQFRGSLFTMDMREAERRAQDAADKIASGEAVSIAVPKPAPKAAPVVKPILTLRKAADQYMIWYGEENRGTSKDRAEPTIDLFVKAMGADRDPKTITRDEIQKWVKERETGRSASTVRGDFSRIRAFLYWISDVKDAADRKCCRRIDLPKLRRNAMPSPSTEKVKAVLRALGNGWIADYCRVLAETGMRPSELLGIRGTDLKGKLLSIKPNEIRELKTDDSERTIMLTDVAAEILTRRKDAMFIKELPIFPNESGEAFQENSVYHIFKDTLAGEKHGKPPAHLNMTLYDFRHFFCSEHAAPGPQHWEMATLGAYIGHAPASTYTLAKFYVDQKALLRGAPTSLIGAPKDGEVIAIKK